MSVFYFNFANNLVMDQHHVEKLWESTKFILFLE